MKRQLIREIYECPERFGGKTITVGGWVRNLRDSKAFGFIDLNDGSYFKSVQVVFEREKINNYDEIASQNVGASLVVTGVLTLTPGAKQPFELKATEIAVEGTSTPDYPLQPKRHTVEFLREQAYLRPRTNLFSAVFRVRSEVAFAIHDFFHSRGFVYVHTPLITGSDAEGAGEMFRVTTLDVDNPPRNEDGSIDWSQDFFGKSANLTVSGQLEGETYAMAFGNIYTFGPTFRAENSNTARHAAEFWMIEPEIAFADLNDDMQLAWDMIKHIINHVMDNCLAVVHNMVDNMIKHIINHVMDNCQAELAFFNQFVDKGLLERLTALRNADYAKVTYTEAIEVLTKAKADFKFPVYWGVDLQTEHERYLTEQVYKKPIFLIDYPKEGILEKLKETRKLPYSKAVSLNSLLNAWVINLLDYIL